MKIYRHLPENAFNERICWSLPQYFRWNNIDRGERNITKTKFHSIWLVTHSENFNWTLLSNILVIPELYIFAQKSRFCKSQKLTWVSGCDRIVERFSAIWVLSLKQLLRLEYPSLYKEKEKILRQHVDFTKSLQPEVIHVSPLFIYRNFRFFFDRIDWWLIERMITKSYHR